MSSGLRFDEIVRSDALADISELRKHNAMLKQLIEEPLQIRLVLDANIVQREIRWRLRSRRSTEARSALHEAIDSGTVLPFAPTALAREIDEHIWEIADYAGVTDDQARKEWAKFSSLIHFYKPETTTTPGQYLDPDDAPYKQVCIELGAHAVYTRDPHFKSMDVPLIMLDLDQVFRTYARANSVKLAVSIGSTFTLTISISALRELFRLSLKGMRRIPPPLQIAFCVAIAGILIHPRSRARIVEACGSIWTRLNNPRFRRALSSLIFQLAEAHETARTASKEIEAAVPKLPKRSAIVHAREICLVERSPIALAMIETRMRAAGYVTRSRRFRSYLCQLLRRSPAFVEVSHGIWTLQTAVKAA
jgi:predicted nucleic acid-binding protein